MRSDKQVTCRHVGSFFVMVIVLSAAACGGGAPATVPVVGVTPPSAAQLATVTPIPWPAVVLDGRAVLTHGNLGLSTVDLGSGQSSTLWPAPPRSWLGAAAFSPAGDTAVLAYAAPPPEGQVQFGFTGLYTVKLGETSEPQPLLEPASNFEIYSMPLWSPDGDAVYYMHYLPEYDAAGAITGSIHTIERLVLSGGPPEVLITGGFWPRLSRDGMQIVYVTAGEGFGVNALRVAQTDGRGDHELVSASAFVAVDAPLFSPDGAYVYFSAVSEATASLSWLDWLTGVRVASAHNVPSDWWRVPVEGGTPERLTQLNDLGLFGDFSPDGEHFIFISATGLYVMRPDGSALTQLRNTPGPMAVQWLP